MLQTIRKFAVGAAVAFAALTLSGTSALAFECYNATRSAQGNASAAKAQGLISFDEALVMFCGVAPGAVPGIKATLGAQGFKTDFLINGHTLMAQGLEKNGKGEAKLHDGQAIDHLSDAFFVALVALVPACA